MVALLGDKRRRIERRPLLPLLVPCQHLSRRLPIAARYPRWAPIIYRLCQDANQSRPSHARYPIFDLDHRPIIRFAVCYHDFGSIPWCKQGNPLCRRRFPGSPLPFRGRVTLTLHHVVLLASDVSTRPLLCGGPQPTERFVKTFSRAVYRTGVKCHADLVRIFNQRDRSSPSPVHCHGTLRLEETT